MARHEPSDPGELPDLPAGTRGRVQLGVGASPVIVRSPSLSGLSLDPGLDAALGDDHTEDTPPTAIPGHYGYSADELVLRLADDDEDDDPEATALRKPVVGSAPEEANVVAAAAPEAVAERPAEVAPEVAAMPASASAAPGSAAPGSVSVPLWAVAATFFGLGLMAGCLLTLFVMGL